MLISVIIPAYNVEVYIAEALDSLLVQSYPDWEAIVVDDGSTDATGKIADEYARKDSRFKVIHQANQGVSAARNRALDECHGDYFCFLDADDFWHPDYLKQCHLSFHEHPELSIICFNHLFSAKPAFHSRNTLPALITLDCSNHISGQLWNIALWEAAYSKKLFGKMRFGPYTFAEDILFFRQCLMECSAVGYLNCTLYAYRERQGSAMCSPMTLRKITDSLLASVDCFKFLKLSGKILDKKQYRLLMRSIFEWPLLWFCQLPKESKRSQFFSLWKECTEQITQIGGIPLWYRMRHFLSRPFYSSFFLYFDMAFPLYCVLKAIKARDSLLRWF